MFADDKTPINGKHGKYYIRNYKKINQSSNWYCILIKSFVHAQMKWRFILTYYFDANTNLNVRIKILQLHGQIDLHTLSRKYQFRKSN